jgi:BCD family chlorophyll transporter-like MFS transporter
MIPASNKASTGLSWWHIVRLGLIQTSLGGIVVLTTSTLNRIMVVELALAATIPGFLVTIHHVVQLARPRIGYGSDVGGRRTPWIIGGMFILGLGGVLAALGTTLIPNQYWLGLSVSALGFFAIGVGPVRPARPCWLYSPSKCTRAQASCRGTRVVHDDHRFRGHRRRRGHFLDPYSPERLMMVTSIVSALAIMVTLIVIRGIEPRATRRGGDLRWRRHRRKAPSAPRWQRSGRILKRRSSRSLSLCRCSLTRLRI